VERAAEVAAALGVAVHVVSAYDSKSAGEWMAAAGGVVVSAGLDTAQEARARAEEIVAMAREQLETRGVEVHTHVCSGDASQALVTIADEHDAQMIVVGNRGMSGARRVLGSVPNNVSHHAHCGVFIVPTT
jgi:nucleotide-binding universal stress UspA family protein